MGVFILFSRRRQAAKSPVTFGRWSARSKGYQQSHMRLPPPTKLHDSFIIDMVFMTLGLDKLVA